MTNHQLGLKTADETTEQYHAFFPQALPILIDAFARPIADTKANRAARVLEYHLKRVETCIAVGPAINLSKDVANQIIQLEADANNRFE